MPPTSAHLIALILPVISMSACKTWYKPGAGDDELASTQKQCEQASGTRNGEAYHDCMQRAGWKQLGGSSTDRMMSTNQTTTATVASPEELPSEDKNTPGLSSWTQVSDDARPLGASWKLCADANANEKDFQDCMQEAGWRPTTLRLWVGPPGEDD